MGSPRRAALDPVYAAALATALELAAAAGRVGEVPVGAVVLGPDGLEWGRGANERERGSGGAGGGGGDVLGHAEVVALRAAARHTGSWRLTGATLVVTLEPCPMCCWAAQQARVERVVFAAWDDKAGACGSVWDLARDSRALHRMEVIGGVAGAAEASAALLREFFAARR
ncbi:MAG TPA: nucleoside deaminase [Phycicoccus sp.]|nr:nucleoside deaminase [Phycicoccus sp.]